MVPDRKATMHVLRSGCQRVCARMSPWVEPCDIVVWHPGPQGSTTRETIRDPRRKLIMEHKATSAKAIPSDTYACAPGYK